MANNTDEIKIVEKLNYELYDRGEEELAFSFSTTGNAEAILFDDHVLWCDQDDGREYFDGNNREPLETYIRREFNRYADRLLVLKFDAVPPPPTVEDDDEEKP